jgi:hypothetical protein
MAPRSLLVVAVLVLVLGPAHAQPTGAAVQRCARFVGGDAARATLECRTRLAATASRFRTDPASVIDTLIAGVERLRAAGVETPLLKIIGIDGLTRLVRNGRSFGTMLDRYLTHRIERGRSHDAAVAALEAR